MEIILYLPPPSATRFKLYIPYAMKKEREFIKTIATSFYHPNQKLWSLVNSKENIKLVKDGFKGKIAIQNAQNKPVLPKFNLSEQGKNALAEAEKVMILKAYSHNTVKVYKNELARFFSFFDGKPFENINKNEIENYVHHLIVKYKISPQKQNLIINAIKCYYEHVLKRDRSYYNIQRPNKGMRLPNVLTKQEVQQILNATKNLKHQAILTTIYSAGLRLSELLNLRNEDIHSKKHQIFVKDAKGNKDRYTILSAQLLKLLRLYYVNYKPAYWLFEGQSGGKYSATSVQKIFRKAVKEAKINPWATVHTLRHSFATHLMLKGVNMRFIQNILGHSSSKTTEIYTHILDMNNKIVKSPLDDLGININFNNNGTKN